MIHRQQMVRSSANVTPPVTVPGAVGAPQPPPVGGVDLKNAAVKPWSGVSPLHEDVMASACKKLPLVLHIEEMNSETEPPVHGDGGAQAQPVHERVSVAPVPAVLRLGKLAGHADLPFIAMQLARLCVPPAAQI